MVVGGGFEPPKLSRQIYSLIPLATREPHHTLRDLNWCRHEESNPGPTDYKSVALPTELYRRNRRSGAYLTDSQRLMQALFFNFLVFLLILTEPGMPAQLPVHHQPVAAHSDWVVAGRTGSPVQNTVGHTRKKPAH